MIPLLSVITLLLQAAVVSLLALVPVVPPGRRGLHFTDIIVSDSIIDSNIAVVNNIGHSVINTGSSIVSTGSSTIVNSDNGSSIIIIGTSDTGTCSSNTSTRCNLLLGDITY